jgi:hypothetical protein
MDTKKVEEAIKTLLEEAWLTGEEEIEDVEVVSFGVKASDTTGGNSPCGHKNACRGYEGEMVCPRL